VLECWSAALLKEDIKLSAITPTLQYSNNPKKRYLKNSMIARMNAGKSSGDLLVIRFPSTTTS